MHLLIPCMKCFQEFGKPTEEFARVEFRDDGKHELMRSNGHEETTILQQQKFEVPFDIGAHAIVAGDYRESISPFASSPEHFYEFSIRTFLSEASGSDNLLKTCWKSVSNQSERRLGAFTLLWASNFNTSPALLSPNKVSFRNDVVHKGKIPTKEEAIAFGDTVINVLRTSRATSRIGPTSCELPSAKRPNAWNYLTIRDHVRLNHCQPKRRRSSTFSRRSEASPWQAA